jgi:hypothetical protein
VCLSSACCNTTSQRCEGSDKAERPCRAASPPFLELLLLLLWCLLLGLLLLSGLGLV